MLLYTDTLTHLLHIETATTVCSVAISIGEQVLALKESNEVRNHAESLTVFIQEVAEQASVSLHDLDAVVVSKGPGSYTGLRIGVATAKGLCFSLDKPLIAINTLQLMANHVRKMALPVEPGANVLICPMLDARRMEVYSAFYDLNNQVARETAADIIDADSYTDLLDKYKIVFCGNGAPKCQSLLEKHPNAFFLNEIHPSARYMPELAAPAFTRTDFVDVAYFEPFYLKDFYTPGKV